MFIFSALPKPQTGPKLISWSANTASVLWEEYSYLNANVSRYRINYISDDERKHVQLDRSTYSTDLTDLNIDTTYSISVAAVMEDDWESLPSDNLTYKTCGCK